MTASNDTVKEIARVILRHVRLDVAKAIAIDLREVPGNKSFRETIERLARELDEA